MGGSKIVSLNMFESSFHVVVRDSSVTDTL
jgi:hypothetical protein